MARALQCPTCRAKHPVSSLPKAPTFRCTNCGQTLKVPAALRSGDHGRHAPAEAKPVPKAAPVPARDGTAAMKPPAPAPSPRPRRGRLPASSERAAGLAPLVLRILAWLVAMPVGFIVVMVAARKSRWLSGQRLVDVFTTGAGIHRYLQWRVLVLAPVWALITTALWYGIVALGRWLLARRRAIRESRARRVADKRAPGDDGRDGGAPDRDLAGAAAQRAGRTTAPRGTGS